MSEENQTHQNWILKNISSLISTGIALGVVWLISSTTILIKENQLMAKDIDYMRSDISELKQIKSYISDVYLTKQEANLIFKNLELEIEKSKTSNSK